MSPLHEPTPQAHSARPAKNKSARLRVGPTTTQTHTNNPKVRARIYKHKTRISQPLDLNLLSIRRLVSSKSSNIFILFIQK
jgi:hypothetical protein